MFNAPTVGYRMMNNEDLFAEATDAVQQWDQFGSDLRPKPDISSVTVPRLISDSDVNIPLGERYKIAGAPMNTDQVPEGFTNLYFTVQRLAESLRAIEPITIQVVDDEIVIGFDGVFDGDVVVRGKLTVESETLLQGPVTVEATTELKEDVLARKDMRVQGDLTVNGNVIVVETEHQKTTRLEVTNNGTGPAMIIDQQGPEPIADFQDDGVSVFHIADGGNVTATGNFSLQGNMNLASGSTYQINGSPITTTQIPEGTNEYFTIPRARSVLSALFPIQYASSTGVLSLNATTTDIPEGTRLYHTVARARSAISATSPLVYNASTGVMALNATTTDIPEGSNLYFTNGRVFNSLTSDGSVQISFVNNNVVLSTTGVLPHDVEIAGDLVVDGEFTVKGVPIFFETPIIHSASSRSTRVLVGQAGTNVQPLRHFFDVRSDQNTERYFRFRRSGSNPTETGLMFSNGDASNFLFRSRPGTTGLDLSFLNSSEVFEQGQFGKTLMNFQENMIDFQVPVQSEKFMGTSTRSPLSGWLPENLTQNDARMILYNLSENNWAGLGADTGGNVWIKTGTSTNRAFSFLTNGRMGVNLAPAEVEETLHVGGSFQSNSTATIGGQTFLNGALNLYNRFVYRRDPAGNTNTLLDFDFPDLTTGTAGVRIFRGTPTSGSAVFDICSPGSTTVNHRLRANDGVSFLNANNGRLGIGTTVPASHSLLNIAGLTQIDGNLVLTNRPILFHNHTDNNWKMYRGSTADFTKSLATGTTLNINAHSGSNQGFAIGRNGGVSYYEILGGDDSTTRHFMRGNVGIGTANPAERLHVVGRQVLESSETNYMFDGHTAVGNSAVWGYEFRTRRSRGTLENPEAVQNNDVLFGIFNRGSRLNNDQTVSAPNNNAAFRVLASGDFTQSSTPTRMDFATTDIGSTARAIRMTINHDGNVGIGTTDPLQKLTIADTNEPFLRFDRTGAGRFDFEIGMPGSADLIFRGGADGTGNQLNELMRITGDGNVSIGGNMNIERLWGSDAGPVMRVKVPNSSIAGQQEGIVETTVFEVDGGAGGTGFGSNFVTAIKSILRNSNSNLKFITGVLQNGDEQFSIRGDGSAYFSGDVLVDNDLRVRGATVYEGDVTVQQNLRVDGTTNLVGNVLVGSSGTPPDALMKVGFNGLTVKQENLLVPVVGGILASIPNASIGIGTDNPNSKLHVQSLNEGIVGIAENKSCLRLHDSNSGQGPKKGIIFSRGTGDETVAGIQTDVTSGGGAHLDFFTSETDNNPQRALRLTADRNVQIDGNVEVTTTDTIEQAVSLWVGRRSANSNQWNSVAWSPELGIFTAVANFGIGFRIMTSSDGIFWTLQNGPINGWNSITWSSERGIFVAVGFGEPGHQVITSPDGINWTGRNASNDGQWRSVVWSSEIGLFVAVSQGGSGQQVMTSPDGITWTGRNAANGNGWMSVTWASELNIFVAVASFGFFTQRVMTSPNGINWTGRDASHSAQWNSVAWSGHINLFVAVSLGGSGPRIMSSPDGIVWTGRNAPNNNLWSSVISQFGFFLAVGYGNANQRVMRSFDGIHWTGFNAPNNEWRSVAFSPQLNTFACVSNFGAENRVMTSSLSGSTLTVPNVIANSYFISPSIKLYSYQLTLIQRQVNQNICDMMLPSESNSGSANPILRWKVPFRIAVDRFVISIDNDEAGGATYEVRFYRPFSTGVSEVQLYPTPFESAVLNPTPSGSSVTSSLSVREQPILYNENEDMSVKVARIGNGGSAGSEYCLQIFGYQIP